MSRKLSALFFLAVVMTQMAGCGESKIEGKSKIETNCTINGLGNGSCSFTNTGNGSGAVCGKVTMTAKYGGNPKTASSTFCSGKVEPSSTTQVGFHVPDVTQLCTGSGTVPMDAFCQLSWEEAH